MYTLWQSRKIRGSAGEPLPTVFPSLAAKGTELLRGQLALVAAGPGTGKSAFVLTIALRARVPTLYFSADSDAFTQLVRSMSILTGMDLEASAHAVRNDMIPADVADEVKRVPVRMVYRASPTLDDIELEMSAYEEVYGEYPSLVVVDNVTNVRTDAGDPADPFSGLESLMDYLSTMARDTEACVIGLHHVTGLFNDSERPIPLSGVKGQISRVPSLVLTLHARQDDDFSPAALCVSTVKNRGGRADPSGREFVELTFTKPKMQIADFWSDQNQT